MNAILVTLNVILLSSLAALAYHWPPALFAFLIVGPLSVLSLWGASRGGISARVIFVTTAATAIVGIVVSSHFWPDAWYGALLVGPIVLLGIADMTQSEACHPEEFPRPGACPVPLRDDPT